MRFASVYRGFSTIEDFEREVAGLKALRKEQSVTAETTSPQADIDLRHRAPVRPPG
jgi:hypothetical protein